LELLLGTSYWKLILEIIIGHSYLIFVYGNSYRKSLLENRIGKFDWNFVLVAFMGEFRSNYFGFLLIGNSYWIIYFFLWECEFEIVIRNSYWKSLIGRFIVYLYRKLYLEFLAASSFWKFEWELLIGNSDSESISDFFVDSDWKFFRGLPIGN